MCTWNPFFPETLDRIEKSNVRRLVILPLFPQFSVTTTGSGFALLKQLIERRPRIKQLNTSWVRSWHDHPTYIASFTDLVQRELAKFKDPDAAHLLFSAHSIPESYVKNGDPYLEQTRRSVELIMDRLGRRNSYQLSFQSKIGPVKWLEPSTNDVIIDLGKRGVHDVLVIPISFVSEHIETLYELDILYKHVAEDAGVTNLRRVPALNSDPTFIRALAEIVTTTLKTG
jgi:ferrochelatase